MTAINDDELPPSPVRTLSAQRVAITMNPDGSIIKHKPPPPSALARQAAEAALDEELELDHPTVAAPVRGPELDTEEPVAPTSLQGLPIDTGAVAETAVMKDAVDDERTHEVTELGPGNYLNETKHIMNGVPKEDLWLLMRRFDKNVQHVRAIDPNKKLHGGKLDLRIADRGEDPFSPEKLRTALERLYLTVGLGMLAFSKHMARLSNWTDQNRTAVFAGVYFVAWIFNILLPIIGIFLVVLITIPASRPLCFPPESLAVIDHATSTNAPAAPGKGEKHSTDSATGAPETQKGEAAEQEATSFIAGIGSLAIGIGTGTEGPSEKGEDKSVLPDPVTVAGRATDAMDTAAQGRKHHTKDNKTKVPVQNAMWEAAKPAMHGLAAMCDTWEKLGNALSPTPPFHRNGARLRLAALLVPLIVGAPLIDYAVIFKGIGFAVGVGFFGQVWIIKYSQEGLAWLNAKYPNWIENLDLGRTILRGVPTDAQLTLTLLRIAESQNDPLPPPPSTMPTGQGPPPTRQNGPQFDKDDDSSDSESDDDLEHPYEVGQANASDANGTDGQTSSKKGARSRLAGLLRGTAKVGAGAIELVHGAEAATTGAARDKVGVLPPRMARTLPEEGPDVFSARHRGKRGFLVLERGTTGPSHADVRFVRGRKSTEAARVNIADVVEVRKLGGLGWKGRLLAGWALGVDIPDGVELTTRAGEKVVFTAMPRRDELFNRLVAMGAQRWEAC